MASHLDLEEQEQLEALKAFWKKYGNPITWVITLILAAYAGYMGWNMWKAKQAEAATAMYEALAQAADGGDAERAGRAFADLQAGYPRTVQAAQGALLTARLQFDKGQADKAQATLGWAVENASSYRELAALRLAGLLMDAKKYDQAAKALDGVKSAEYAGLAADRRGDIAMLQGKADAAKAEYQKAYAAMDKKLDYRRLVEAKLESLGAAPAADAASGAQQ